MFKNLLTTAIALIFLVTGITSVVGAGKLANVGLETVLGVEDCKFGSRPIPTKEDEVIEPVCEQDTNQTKRDIASGLSMLLISLPVSLMSYRKINAGKKKKR